MSRPRKRVYLFVASETALCVTRLVLQTMMHVKVTATSDAQKAIADMNWAQSGLAPRFDALVVIAGPDAVLGAARRIPSIDVSSSATLRANLQVAGGNMAALLAALRIALKRKKGPKPKLAVMHQCSGNVAETRKAA